MTRPVSPEGPAPTRELLMTIRAALPNSTTRPEIEAAWNALDELLDRSRSAGSPETAPAFNELEHFALRLDAIAESLNTSALDMAIADLRKLARQRAASSAPSPGEAGAPTLTTDAMRNLALELNDSTLRREPVSVSQVREIALRLGRVVEAKSFKEGPALSGDREDSERLDWLTSERHTLCFYGFHRVTGVPRWQIPDWDEGTSPREAIDAARSTPAEKDV